MIVHRLSSINECDKVYDLSSESLMIRERYKKLLELLEPRLIR